jgi:hypothetical protein
LQKILAYVEDEGFNLQTCVQVLKSCGDFDIIKPFDGHFFKHELSKVCQHATLDEKVAYELHYHQSNLPKLQVGVGENICGIWL